MIAAFSLPMNRVFPVIGSTRADRPLLPLSWLVGAILASAALLAGLFWDAGLGVDPFTRGALPILMWFALCFGAACATRRVPGRIGGVAREAALHFAVFSTMTLMGALASYPVAALSHGWSDETLAAIDAGLHFDWLAWYETVAAHPSLQLLGRLAYQSVYLSPAIIIAYFAWTRRTGDARAFMATFWISAILTLTLYVMMPAIGPFARGWRGPIPYMPDSALWQPALIPALRAHVVHIVDLGQLRGLVSAPSFHTVAAVLFICTAWPHARLRWPLLLLNAAMLLSTPVEGTHYLSDMLLGAVVAIVSLIAVEVLIVARARHRVEPAAELAEQR